MHVRRDGIATYMAQAYTELAKESVVAQTKTRTKAAGFSLGKFSVRLTTEEPAVDAAQAVEMARERLARRQALHFSMDMETEQLYAVASQPLRNDSVTEQPAVNPRQGAMAYNQTALATQAPNHTTKSLIAVI